MIIYVDKGIENSESYTPGNIRWYGQYGYSYRGFLKKFKNKYIA